MVKLVQNQVVKREMLHKQAKNYVFMTGSQHFTPGNIQFQLVDDRGQCAKSSYVNNQKKVNKY